MGVSVTINRRGRACGAGAANQDPSCSLHTVALRAEPVSQPYFGGNLHSTTKVGVRERQQSLLARLVEAIDPESADIIAESLLERFGSLGGIFSASPISLSHSANSQAIATILTLARPVVVESMREDVRRVPFDPKDRRIMDYLIATMQGATEEHLHAIFLDSKCCYLTDERVASGSWSQISLRLRPLLRRAIELNSANLVLFHNHPSGNAKPSQSDIEFTCQASAVANAIGIELFDHLIVSGPCVYSMRLAGQLS